MSKTDFEGILKQHFNNAFAEKGKEEYLKEPFGKTKSAGTIDPKEESVLWTLSTKISEVQKTLEKIVALLENPNGKVGKGGLKSVGEIEEGIDTTLKKIMQPFWNREWNSKNFGKIWVNSVLNDAQPLSVSICYPGFYDAISPEVKENALLEAFQNYKKELENELSSSDEIFKFLNNKLKRYCYEHSRHLARKVMTNFPNSVTYLKLTEPEMKRLKLLIENKPLKGNGTKPEIKEEKANEGEKEELIKKYLLMKMIWKRNPTRLQY